MSARTKQRPARLRAGTKIPVMINGSPMWTTIGKDGVQRLPEDPRIAMLFECGALDLNKLAIAVKRDGSCSMEVQRWVYLRLGYSVTGYEEIFPKDEIVNPLWK